MDPAPPVEDVAGEPLRAVVHRQAAGDVPPVPEAGRRHVGRPVEGVDAAPAVEDPAAGPVGVGDHVAGDVPARPVAALGDLGCRAERVQTAPGVHDVPGRLRGGRGREHDDVAGDVPPGEVAGGDDACSRCRTARRRRIRRGCSRPCRRGSARCRGRCPSRGSTPIARRWVHRRPPRSRRSSRLRSRHPAAGRRSRGSR